MSGVIMLTKDDNGNVTMGLGMPPEEALGMLVEAAMRLATEYNLNGCDCPPGTHDPIPAPPGFDEVIAPSNDYSGLAASLRRAKELKKDV
jgi:MinD superfamily P-loop ATPase